MKPAGSQPDRRAALEALARAYWKPVYAYLRVKWNRSREEAEDLTQEFFAWVLEGPFLDRAEPGRGRFRGFVRAHLDHFVQNHLRDGKRLKRGGGRKILSLEAPEQALVDSREVPPEELLDRQWRQAVLDQALERLRRALEAEGKSTVFAVLQKYDMVEGSRRPTYVALAAELGITPADVDNFLSSARRRLYEFLREVVAATVEDEDALREELDSFFPGASA